MKRLTDAQLFELFDKPAKWRTEIDEEELYMAYFFVGGIEYAFKAKHSYSAWGIYFGVAEAMDSEEDADDKAYGITGTGNQFEVFSTVKVILYLFLDVYQPDSFSFSAIEPSRVKLYDHFARNLERDIPYILTTTEGIYVFSRMD